MVRSHKPHHERIAFDLRGGRKAWERPTKNELYAELRRLEREDKKFSIDLLIQVVTELRQRMRQAIRVNDETWQKSTSRKFGWDALLKNIEQYKLIKTDPFKPSKDELARRAKNGAVKRGQNKYEKWKSWVEATKFPVHDYGKYSNLMLAAAMQRHEYPKGNPTPFKLAPDTAVKYCELYTSTTKKQQPTK